MEKNRNFKNACSIILVLLCILLTACGDNENYDGPPDYETPPPLDGIYEGEYGKLVFNGDGETVVAEFTGEAAKYISGGEMKISFRWYAHGVCPYNVATECSMYSGETEYAFDCLGTDADTVRLTLMYVSSEGSVTPIDSGKLEMVFKHRK